VQGPQQLASYTVDSQGALTTTNTYEQMPRVDGWPTSMMLDHTGKILAVTTGPGVQFFHFNGAKPITEFTGIVGVSGAVTQMAWDSDDHLYAQNVAHGKMHVYEVTTKSVKELSGSGTVIPQGTFVVRTK
jgi:6-phosphogluconolactonase (cycloisomerase 2 family)